MNAYLEFETSGWYVGTNRLSTHPYIKLNIMCMPNAVDAMVETSNLMEVYK